MNATIETTTTAQIFPQTFATRDELITEHLYLVNSIAAHVQKSLAVHVELDDLINAGVIGLMDAMKKYDPAKQVMFKSYAQFRIRGAILDSLREFYPSARVAHAYASTEAGVGFDVNDGLEGFPASLVAATCGSVHMQVIDGSLRIRSPGTALRYLGSSQEALFDPIVLERGERWGEEGSEEIDESDE